MKLALASNLHTDLDPSSQRIDWRLVHKWTGVDVLVLAGNISQSLDRARLEVLAAREAFGCVIFVEGNQERQLGHPVLDGTAPLREFAARHDGIHCLDGGSGVLVGRTLVCGTSGWDQCQAIILASRIREGAANQEIQEIVAVTHAAPFIDPLGSEGSDIRNGMNDYPGSPALVPLWSDCLDGGKMTVWCFGHAAHSLDFTSSGVRFVCNPQGPPSNAGKTPYCVHLIDTMALAGDMWGEAL